MPVHDRTVLLIDGGVATGGTVRAALEGLRRAEASRVVLGLPVGPPDVVASLGEEADEVARSFGHPRLTYAASETRIRRLLGKAEPTE